MAQPKAREHRRERRPEGGGQPHRKRNGEGSGSAPSRESQWNPLAGERPADGAAKPAARPQERTGVGRSYRSGPAGKPRFGGGARRAD